MSTLLQLLGHIASGLNVIAFAALTAGIFLSIGDFLFPYSWAIGAFCQDYAPSPGKSPSGASVCSCPPSCSSNSSSSFPPKTEPRAQPPRNRYPPSPICRNTPPTARRHTRSSPRIAPASP